MNFTFSTGFVTGVTAVGGLCGDNLGTVENSFWDIETSGQATSGCGDPKTTAELKDDATVVGWDFSIWDKNDDGYPNLDLIAAPPTAPAASTSTGGGSSSSTQCSDGRDNDGDGLIDLADPGCESRNDDSEFNECTESWVCESWASCIGDSKSRECFEINDCGTEEKKPKLTKACISKVDDSDTDKTSDTDYTYYSALKPYNLLYKIMILFLIIMIFIIILLKKIRDLRYLYMIKHTSAYQYLLLKSE